MISRENLDRLRWKFPHNSRHEWPHLRKACHQLGGTGKAQKRMGTENNLVIFKFEQSKICFCFEAHIKE